MSVVSVKTCCYSNPGHDINVFKNDNNGTSLSERLRESLASLLQVNRILDFSILYVEQKWSGRRGFGDSSKNRHCGPGNTPICY